MRFLLYIAIFVFGLCIGSFLNCVIYRLQKTKSFLKGRSICPKCKHILKWYDLLPVVSFIALRGKCRYCRKKISWQYPLVELGTALIFILIFNFQFSIFNFQTFYLLVTACFLIIIFIYDLKTYFILDKIIYPAIGIVLLWNIFNNWSGLLMLLLTAFLSAAFFFIIWLLSKGKAMGFGDAKLGFLMGLFLGFPGILVALFFAFLGGALVGLGLISSGKKKLKSQVPFGPFLITGTFVALFWGEKIVSWYLSIGAV